MKSLQRVFNQLRSSPISHRPRPLENALQVVLWWELRRILFNLCVGVAGGSSLLLVLGVALTSERLTGEPVSLPDPPLIILLGVVAYAVAANLFYTLGWMAELVVRGTSATGDSTAFAASAFALGLIGSVLLTLLPGVVIALMGTIALGVTIAGRTR